MMMVDVESYDLVAAWLIHTHTVFASHHKDGGDDVGGSTVLEENELCQSMVQHALVSSSQQSGWRDDTSWRDVDVGRTRHRQDSFSV